MKISSSGIKDGIFKDQYGKRGSDSKLSFPLKIEDQPKETISFAIFVEDKDAVPVCGYSWIHWTVANLTKTELVEGESKFGKDFIQGVNSDCGYIMQQSKEDSIGFTAFGPPDAPHEYEIHVYALDCMLDLKNGFYMNELFKKMRGHVLEETILRAVYNN